MSLTRVVVLLNFSVLLCGVGTYVESSRAVDFACTASGWSGTSRSLRLRKPNE